MARRAGEAEPIDFVDVIPGHGDPFKGKERIDWFQAYLRDLWKQGSALHDRRCRGRRGEAHRHDRPQGALPGDYRARRQLCGLAHVRGDGRARRAVASSLQEAGNMATTTTTTFRHAAHRCARRRPGHLRGSRGRSLRDRPGPPRRRPIQCRRRHRRPRLRAAAPSGAWCSSARCRCWRGRPGRC